MMRTTIKRMDNQPSISRIPHPGHHNRAANNSIRIKQPSATSRIIRVKIQSKSKIRHHSVTFILRIRTKNNCHP